jgi:hypothetical protein
MIIDLKMASVLRSAFVAARRTAVLSNVRTGCADPLPHPGCGPVATTSSGLQAFSTQSKASAAVHGEINASQVRSKAMRSKLAGGASAVARAADPQEQLPTQAQAPQQEAGPTTFWGVMGGNMLQGFAISLGFMLVFGIARAVGMEGEREQEEGEA